MHCRHILLAAAAGLLLTATARADEIVGGPVNAANTQPFSSTVPFTEFQQIYPASDFSGPISITGLQFTDTYFGNGDAVDNGTYTLSLETVSASGFGATLLDVTGATQIFSGALTGAVEQPDLAFTGSTSFSYDPNAGNLLLDVTVSGLNTCLSNSTACGAVDFNYLDAGKWAFATPGYSGVPAGTYANSGTLVTDFVGTAEQEQSAPVPEPASAALLGAGLLGLLRTRRRKG